ncbi:MAG: hypothetical protein AAFN44_05190 [Pseudomonadota bacterium]
MGRKIATCNYCGTRAVLVFDEARHELTCSACGAPLHNMKFMPQDPEKNKKKIARTQASKYAPSAAVTGTSGKSGSGKPARTFNEKKPGKRKKKKTFFKRVLEEIIDEIEDIFD